jgi:hypothetical protein
MLRNFGLYNSMAGHSMNHRSFCALLENMHLANSNGIKSELLVKEKLGNYEFSKL